MNLKGYIDKIRTYIDDVHSLPLPLPLVRSIIVVQILYRDINNNDLPKQAQAMVYITMMALVPSLVAVFALISVFTPMLSDGIQLVDKLQNFIIHNLAQGTGDQVADVLKNLLVKHDIAKMGVSFFVGFIVTLILLLKNIEKTFNRIWLVRKERGMLTRFIYFWTFITLGAFIGTIAVGFAADFNFSSLNPFEGSAIEIERTWVGQKLISFFTGFFLFVSMYFIVPNCKVRKREASIGAAVASLLFMLASSSFSLYIDYFSKHQQVYGAFAALPVFLVWLWICWIIILLGGVVSWRTQQGFEFKKKEEIKEVAASPTQQLRQLRMRSLMPFFVLMAVYKKYLQDEGVGLSGMEAKKKFDINGEWIVESLELLEEMGYIAPVGAQSSQDTGDYMGREFLPRYAPSNIKIEKIYSDLLINLSELGHWQEEFPQEYAKVFLSITKMSVDQQSKVSLLEGLQSV